MHHARHHARPTPDRRDRARALSPHDRAVCVLYAALHFTTYFWFDKWFDVAEILKDIGKRPFITVGFAAFVLLIPLAVTSPKAMVRKLGRRWQTLHRAIYVIAALAILHFWWMKAGKHDLILPKIYGAIVIALLGWRLVVWLKSKAATRA